MNKKKIFLILCIILILVMPICYGINEENLEIHSEAVILIDSKLGKIIYEKNSNKKMYPASTTKILTAIIALENCNLQDEVIASSYAINCVPKTYSTAYILPGEKLTIEELLNMLLIHSANDAGFILAEHISGSTEEFSNLMNEKALKIGCTNSHFTNPSGIHNENHYSTASDLSKIATYCMKNETFKNIVSLKECTISATNKSNVRKYKNTNLLLHDGQYYYPYCIGIKTGFTNPAKDCLISASKKDNLELICVVLQSDTSENGENYRYIDTINLFNYAYENYTPKIIYKIIYLKTYFKNFSKYLFNLTKLLLESFS